MAKPQDVSSALIRWSRETRNMPPLISAWLTSSNMALPPEEPAEHSFTPALAIAAIAAPILAPRPKRGSTAAKIIANIILKILMLLICYFYYLFFLFFILLRDVRLHDVGFPVPTK